MKIRLSMSGERSLLLTKWLIFSITLPLLPIVCKVLAEWMDEGKANWRGSNLFGDGELLVIATVIAAAGIGDLVFDLRRNKRRRSFRDASAIALALICVVISVTLYALVTLKREQLTPGQQAVANSVKIQEDQVAQISAQNRQLLLQVESTQALRDKAFTAYQAEVRGANGNPPGIGTLARELYARYQDLSNQLSVDERQLESNRAQLGSAQHALTGTRLEANEALTTGRSTFDASRAAVASMWMFFLGLLAGLNCLLAGSARRHRQKKRQTVTEPSDGLPLRPLNGFDQADARSQSKVWDDVEPVILAEPLET